MRSVLPVDVMGSKEPLLTTIEQGVGYHEGTSCESVLELEDMWEVAPESKYHSMFCWGWFSVMVLKVDARECWFQDGRPAGEG